MSSVLNQIKEHLFSTVIRKTNVNKEFYTIVDEVKNELDSSLLVIDGRKYGIEKEESKKFSIRFDLGGRRGQKFNWILYCKDSPKIAVFAAQISLFGNVGEEMGFIEDLMTQFLAAIYIYTANLASPTPNNAYKLICQTELKELLELLSKSNDPVISNTINSMKQMNQKLIYGCFLAIKNKLKWLENDEVFEFTDSTEIIDFARLRKEKLSIYIGVLEDKDNLISKNLALIVLSCALAQLIQSVKGKKVYLVIRELGEPNKNSVFHAKVVLGRDIVRVFKDCHVLAL